jgi:hypothetical protein
MVRAASTIVGMEPEPRTDGFPPVHRLVRGGPIMRLILLILVVLLGIDAYAFSGAYTQYAVHEVSTGVQRLASRIDAKTDSERPAPPRPTPDRNAG